MTQTKPAIERSTHERFLDAGLSVFVRHGFVQASMEQVAEEAGLSRAGLYKHFANKDALFLEVCAMLHAGAEEACAASAEQSLRNADAPDDAIIGFILTRRRYFAKHMDRSPHAAELLEETNDRCGAIARRHGQMFRRSIADLVKKHVSAKALTLKPSHSPDAVADMFLAAAKGLQIFFPLFGKAGFEAAFDLMARTILSGSTEAVKKPKAGSKIISQQDAARPGSVVSRSKAARHRK